MSGAFGGAAGGLSLLGQTASALDLQGLLGGGLLGDTLGEIAAIIRQPRKIGTIIPDVTIEEHFSDRLQVTQHPLAKGTPISDHAFMLPKTVTMRCGFSNSSLGAAIGGGISTLLSGGSMLDAGGEMLGGFTEKRASQIYAKFLKLQRDREPFALVTGKRPKDYPAMVITELSVTNDRTTEYALIIEVQMQELILIDIGNAATPPQSSQAVPQTTQPQTDGGTAQPTPRTSTMYDVGGGGRYNKKFQ